MNRSVLILIVLVLSVFLLFNCSKAEKTEKAAAPMGLGYHNMAYDGESKVSIIFGGQPRDYDLTMTNKTWAYSTSDTIWNEMKPEIKPQPSAADAIAWDSESDRIIIFMGQETWSYDYNSNSWQKQNPVSSPSTIFGSTMVYDSESDRMILFGLFSGETWVYDFNNDSWENMKPEKAPCFRVYQAMAYDAESDKVVLFGGGDGPEPPWFVNIFDDTWIYDYNVNEWTEVKTDMNPGGRVYAEMVYVPSIDRIILYGGEALGKDQPVDNNIWSFDTDTGTWEIYETEETLPALRKHAMVFDTAAHSLLIYGGISGTVNTDASPQFSDRLYVVKIE